MRMSQLQCPAHASFRCRWSLTHLQVSSRYGYFNPRIFIPHKMRERVYQDNSWENFSANTQVLRLQHTSRVLTFVVAGKDTDNAEK